MDSNIRDTANYKTAADLFETFKQNLAANGIFAYKEALDESCSREEPVIFDFNAGDVRMRFAVNFRGEKSSVNVAFTPSWWGPTILGMGHPCSRFVEDFDAFLRYYRYEVDERPLEPGFKDYVIGSRLRQLQDRDAMREVEICDVRKARYQPRIDYSELEQLMKKSRCNWVCSSTKRQGASQR